MIGSLVPGAKIPEGILKGFWKDPRNWTKHFPPLEEPRRYLAGELLVKH